MIQHLMNCDSCRSRFIETMEFEKLANNIRFYPEVIKRHETKTVTHNITLNSGSDTTVISLEESLNNATKDDSEGQEITLINLNTSNPSSSSSSNESNVVFESILK